jgi:hypothetical protein
MSDKFAVLLTVVVAVDENAPPIASLPVTGCERITSVLRGQHAGRPRCSCQPLRTLPWRLYEVVSHNNRPTSGKGWSSVSQFDLLGGPIFGLGVRRELAHFIEYNPRGSHEKSARKNPVEMGQILDRAHAGCVGQDNTRPLDAITV